MTAPSSPHPLFINGKDHQTKDSYEVHSPDNGKLLHRFSAASVEDANSAVKSAAEALPAWRKTTPAQRRDIFLKASDAMYEKSEELIDAMTSETGATRAWAQRNVTEGVEMLRAVGGLIPTLHGTFPALNDVTSSAIITYEPYGVVLAIAPWNAPYVLGTRSIAFPLAAGNTVVFKGTEMAPRTMAAIVSVFRQAGVPDGVLNFLVHKPHDGPEITKVLVANQSVRKVNFTGSTNVGRIIGSLCGQHLKPIVQELGGKAPAIVWEDADLTLAAKACAEGAFLNAGQICMSTEKILVHKNIKDDFSRAFAAAISEAYPESKGALTLINAGAVDKNKKLVADATKKGAKLLHGDPAQGSDATHLRPIVVDNVETSMDIYNTESFGPTTSLIEIASEEEAIRLANDTEYGLSSAIYTQDLGLALRFARQIEAGAVHINSSSVHDEPALPHGGAKASGYGRFNGTIGLMEWVWPKSITFKN